MNTLKMKGHLQDIIIGLETGHHREWWTTPISMSSGRMVCPVDFVVDELYGYYFYNHPEFEYWVDGIARIAVIELRIGMSTKFLKELLDFKKMLAFMQEDKEIEYDKDLNGESFYSLYHRYAAKLEMEKNNQKALVRSLMLTPNQDYTIKRITNFQEMQAYYPLTPSHSPWCVAYSERKFDAFSANGANGIYVILHYDYKSINETAGTQRSLSFLQAIDKEPTSPYDDYGLSMILIIIDNEGSLINCTSRWNHTFCHSSHDYLDEYQISMLIGRNFYETFTYCLT